MTSALLDQLTRLINGEHSATGDPMDAGATMVVTDPDGSEAFRAALARHIRVDSEDPQLFWIRPVERGEAFEDPAWPYVFNLNDTRRRSLNWSSFTAEGENTFVLHLQPAGEEPVGQTVRIAPAAGAELEMLLRWDSFFDRLEAHEQDSLERLDADSWHGRFS